jgi:signal transduction histidine kinase/HAMP domain-containing protein
MSDAAGGPVPFHQRLTVRLTGAVILVLLVIGIPFFLAFQRLLRKQQFEAMSEATAALNRVVVDGLRSAMLAGQPHLLNETVRKLSEGPAVAQVLLIDHAGRVRIASDPAYEGRVLDREQDKTCRVCHLGRAGAPASRTAVTRLGTERVFRAMSTIPNEPACHGCHDPRASTNGILVMDLALGTADQRFFAQVGGTLALGALMAALTIATLALLLRRMVHRPLQAVVATSRQIVQGNLDARVAEAGRGEFAQLASQVNQMTAHLARSLRTVDTQRHELQAILDAVDDEIVVLDRELRVVAANEAFRKSAERAGVEIEGRPCGRASPSGARCGVDATDGCPVARVFETGQLHKGILSHVDPEGGERTMEVHASPLRDRDGAVDLVVEVRRDISERRQLEASLVHSERLASLGLLASGVSHEINNPLGVIAMSVDGLRRRLRSEPGIAAEAVRALDPVLQRISGEVQRGRAITNRLLKVARPQRHARSLVDVNLVVEDILAVLSHDIGRAAITTRLELEGELPPLLGDESRLGQVVMNVMLNAIQAMDGGGGTLRVATAAQDGLIRIEVEDTGCGIPAHLLKQVFEPFFTTKPVGRGTGLGLFIAHRLVSEMGGTIQIRSRPEQGTLLIVRLPRSEARGRA